MQRKRWNQYEWMKKLRGVEGSHIWDPTRRARCVATQKRRKSVHGRPDRAIYSILFNAQSQPSFLSFPLWGGRPVTDLSRLARSQKSDSCPGFTRHRVDSGTPSWVCTTFYSPSKQTRWSPIIYIYIYAWEFGGGTRGVGITTLVSLIKLCLL